MVLGSIGYGGVGEIRRLSSRLRKRGFNVLDQIKARGMDYSNVNDFRRRRRLSRRIVQHDLAFLNRADVIVALANRPSYGTAIEMFLANKARKPVILFSRKRLPTPWPINFSDFVVGSEDALIKVLREIREKRGEAIGRL